MTEFEFTQRIRNAVPQTKDIQRAMKIKGMSGYNNKLVAANKQIKLITDHEKFFRRVHAFVYNGLDVDLSGSPIYWQMNTVYAKNFIAMERRAAKEEEDFKNILDSI